ncbi:hypothetical protein CALVIDRAFT_6654 [Calocera viscosa TUFC12733]|uniref:Uncharacterized protein n=1 Tax=Calocera viscosa (strain TUFC12733) TaxID=1330018 RepID=A0A167S1S5_CALVF|nr:hypothetical protein CALVIDRAFT_6654 [Calocera viscosa TUFC12733]
MEEIVVLFALFSSPFFSLLVPVRYVFLFLLVSLESPGLPSISWMVVYRYPYTFLFFCSFVCATPRHTAPFSPCRIASQSRPHDPRHAMVFPLLFTLTLLYLPHAMLFCLILACDLRYIKHTSLCRL